MNTHMSSKAHNVEIVDYHLRRNPFLKNKKMALIHPGEILMEDFLNPMGISQYRLQAHYDLAVEEDHLGKKLEREAHVFAATA